MSEKSFDTSAADTLTSGVSLGQFIKSVAEESQPLERWYELRPTVEKEWHTLQGEPTSQVTLTEEEMTELPLSDVSSTTNRESTNPVASLIKYSQHQTHSSDHTSQPTTYETDLCTPAISTRKVDRTVVFSSQDHFVTPAISHRTKPQSNVYSFLTSPSSAKHDQLPSLSYKSNLLPSQDLPSFFEKDDSLAQRVKDLLEDNVSIRSESSDRMSQKAVQNASNIALLSKNALKPNKSQSTENVVSSTIASKLIRMPGSEDKIDVCDTSNKRETNAKVISPSSATWHLFDDSGFEIEGLYNPLIGTTDLLRSLDTSRGTEYGELPEAVDIPQQIVSRLNNMKLLTQNNCEIKDDLPPRSQNLQSLDMTTSKSVSTVHAPPTKENVAVTSSLSVPIAGNVKFHLGSNPTTPQFPIEEEKLQQLQSYIEKKTGVPSVSPLVAGAESSSKILPQNVTVNLAETPVTTDVTVHADSRASKQPTVGMKLPLKETVQVVVSTGAGGVTPVHFEELQRCDPEGMSPPINNLAGPVSLAKSENVREKKTSPDEKKMYQHDSDSTSHLSEDLADKSLLARIKSALSESSPEQSIHSKPTNHDTSEVSLSSSIDSLAIQVKELLKEEAPKLASLDDQQDNSNLSEVIENFEQTELWKFVAQFLPSAGEQLARSVLSKSNGDTGEAAHHDDTITDLSLEKSIIEKIRSEIQQSFQKDTDGSKVLNQEHEKESSFVDATENAKPTSTTVRPPLPQPQSSGIFPVIDAGIHPKESSESILDVIDEEPLNVDPIPGIPDFSTSVVEPSDFMQPVKKEQTANITKAKTAWPEKNFSRYKQQAQAVIAGQLDRVATRDFDVSLTPARHNNLFRDERVLSEKNIEEYPSHLNAEKDEAVTNQYNTPSPSNRSAYFNNHQPSTITSNRDGEERLPSGRRSRSNVERITPTSDKHETLQVIDRSNVSSIRSVPSSKLLNQQQSPLYTDVNVAPKASSGLPSLSRNTTQPYAYHSAPSNYFQRSVTPTKNSGPYTLSTVPSTTVDSLMSSRKCRSPRSPLRDRVTVHDWLRSPERKRKLEEQKQLPTFQELMEEEEKKEREEEKSLSQNKIQPVLDARECVLKRNTQQDSTKLTTASNSPCKDRLRFEDSVKLGKHQSYDVDGASLRPQLDANDSYQCTSMNTGALHSAASVSSIPTSDNRESSSSIEVRSTIPRSLSDFQLLDEKSQKKFLKEILRLLNKQRTTKHEVNEKHSSSTTALSSSSNQAVCDSDSTEYCDLPSTRPHTAATFDSYSSTIDKMNAEKIMKKLLQKINQQKEQDRRERKTHKRVSATSSTPQKRRPIFTAPEASSIASDTDVANRYIIKTRDHRKHAGHRKVAYVDEICESDLPAYIKVKKRVKKVGVPERIVLHDRSVQTLVSNEQVEKKVQVGLNSKKQEKRAKAVQTSDVKLQFHEADDDDKENRDSVTCASAQRCASFFVKMGDQRKISKPPPMKRPMRKSVAWYEPFKYEPYWMKVEREKGIDGLVPLSLQEALAAQHPDFISRSRERQRRITINADERRLQEIWEEERKRLFGAKMEARPKPNRDPPPPRRSVQISRKQMIAETRGKYEQLPEVVKKREEERKQREYASNRLRAQLYKKKIQNKILGRSYS